jgi:hypothetical protein
MGVFDDIKGFIDGNAQLKNIASRADKLVGKAGGKVDEATGGAMSKASGFLGKAGRPLRRSADSAGEKLSRSGIPDKLAKAVDTGRQRLNNLVKGTGSAGVGARAGDHGAYTYTPAAETVTETSAWKIVPKEVEESGA